MISDARTANEEGFTLVEVLIAMVILAVGLLGLEALAIGAARSVSLAERQSGFAVIAADSLESAMHQLRENQMPTQFCQSDLAFGDRLSRAVDASDPQLVTVTVSVLPDPDAPTARADTFRIASSLFVPVTISGSVTGVTCD